MYAIRNKALAAAVFATTAVLFIGSVLSVWLVWPVHPESWCVVGHLGTLWTSLAWVPQHIRISGVERVWELHLWNVAGLAILSSLSAAVGASVYVSKRRRAPEH